MNAATSVINICYRYQEMLVLNVCLLSLMYDSLINAIWCSMARWSLLSRCPIPLFVWCWTYQQSASSIYWYIWLFHSGNLANKEFCCLLLDPIRESSCSTLLPGSSRCSPSRRRIAPKRCAQTFCCWSGLDCWHSDQRSTMFLVWDWFGLCFNLGGRPWFDSRELAWWCWCC